MNDITTKDISKVSIVMPCRNEKKFINDCINSIIANDYPKDRLEIIIIDGMSDDGTKNIVKRFSDKYPFIRYFENQDRIIPCAMNIGIRNATGDIIMKMDGHATYKSDYISKCVKYLNEYEADNVGGVWEVTPRTDTFISKAISLVLVEPFGSGNAYIKIGTDAPRWNDSVSFGCFRRRIFDRIGLFNEKLIRGSDMDFNKRIIKSGGKILLVPDIINKYFCDASFKAFYRHNYSDGLWTTYAIKYNSMAFSLRHLIPLFFIIGLITSAILGMFLKPFLLLFIAIAGIYLMCTIIVSLKIIFSGKEKNLRFLYLLPTGFIIRHFAHGLGALIGLFKQKK